MVLATLIILERARADRRSVSNAARKNVLALGRKLAIFFYLLLAHTRIQRIGLVLKPYSLHARAFSIRFLILCARFFVAVARQIVVFNSVDLDL